MGVLKLIDITTARKQLSYADQVNLHCILMLKTRLGDFDVFDNLLKEFGKWGRGGILPKALQSFGENNLKRYNISESMMMYLEAHVSELRRKLVEAPDLYYAFRLRYLSGYQAPAYKAKYKAALKSRHKLYSLRGLGRDCASFNKRLRRAILDDLSIND